jgi:hypothetical protein
MEAALLRRQETGVWDSDDLGWLKRERAVLGQDAFSQLVAAKVPQELQQSLGSGIEGLETP